MSGRGPEEVPRARSAAREGDTPTHHPPPTQGESERGEQGERSSPGDAGTPAPRVDDAASEPLPPSDAGAPWRIPGVEHLPEGEGRALFLERPGGGPVLEVVLCRVDGVLYALDSECPHAGGRIQGGPLVDGRYARCPLHWFDFEPATGRCVNVDCEPARTYRVEEQDGAALLYLSE